jgi:hypothetical protein
MGKECILPPGTAAASSRITEKPSAARRRPVIRPEAPAPMIKILDDISEAFIMKRL